MALRLLLAARMDGNETMTQRPGGAAVTGRHAIGALLARGLGGLLLSLLAATASHAAGTLTPVGAAPQPIRIADHPVRVVVTNGFAQTDVNQISLGRLTDWSRS